MEEEKGYLSFSREELLSDLELLGKVYELMGKETAINWILKRDEHEEE